MTAGKHHGPEGKSLVERRNVYPSDWTLENLLNPVRAELELRARSPIYAYEVSAHGNDACASTVRELRAQRASTSSSERRLRR